MQDNSENEALKKAKAYSLRLLAIRPRSKKELADRLKQKDFPWQVVSGVIDDFTARGFLNDLKFSNEWIQARINNNPKGSFLLKRELRQKGVDQGVIEEALEQAKEKYDEKEVALRIARDKKRRFAALDKEKSKRKIYDFLNRRGFSTSTIYEVIKKLYGSYEEDPLD